MKKYLLCLCLFVSGCGNYNVSYNLASESLGDKEMVFEKFPRESRLFYTIKNDVLMDLLQVHFPFSMRNTADPEYAIMNETWFSQILVPSLESEIRQTKNFMSSTYFDCDDYSFLAKLAVSCYYGRSNRHIEKATSVAFGVLYYTIDAPGTERDKVPHAINIIVFIKNGKYELKFYEPQLGDIVELTPKEKLSVVFVKF